MMDSIRFDLILSHRLGFDDDVMKGDKISFCSKHIRNSMTSFCDTKEL